MGTLGQGDESFVVVEVELRFAHLSRLGLDDNYTVGATHTVNGRGRGVFQYGERFDVFGVDVAEATFHTVYQYQRFGVLVGEGGDTANPDVGIVVSRLTRALHGYHTCQTACDGGGEVGGGHLDVIHLHGRLCTYHGHFTLVSIGHYHYFVQCRYVFGKNHVNQGFLVHGDFLRFVSYVGNDKGRIGSSQLQGVLAVDVGNGTVARIFFLYAYSDEEFSFFIGNASCHCSALRVNLQTERCQKRPYP